MDYNKIIGCNIDMDDNKRIRGYDEVKITKGERFMGHNRSNKEKGI